MFVVFVLFQSIFKKFFFKLSYPVPAKIYTINIAIKYFKLLLNALNFFFVEEEQLRRPTFSWSFVYPCRAIRLSLSCYSIASTFSVNIVHFMLRCCAERRIMRHFKGKGEFKQQKSFTVYVNKFKQNMRSRCSSVFSEMTQCSPSPPFKYGTVHTLRFPLERIHTNGKSATSGL